MDEDLKRRMSVELAVDLGTRPPSDLAEVLRRGRGKRLTISLIQTISVILVVGLVVGGGLLIDRISSPSDEGRRSVSPAEEEVDATEPIPCETPDGDDHAGPRCLFGGEVRFRITAGWAEQFESRSTSAMRIAPETLLFYDNEAGTAPMAMLRVIANPAPLSALDDYQEHCSRPDPAQRIASADAFAAAIQAHAGLSSTEPVTEQIAGVDALRLDLAPAPDASTCNGGVPVLTGTRDDAFGPSLAEVVQEGSMMRLYLLDLPPGRAQTLAIAIVAGERSFDAAIAAAEPLLDTFQLNQAAPGSTVWSPVQERGSGADVSGDGRWDDPVDAPVEWVDIRRVRLYNADRPHWAIELKKDPPRAKGLEPGRLIAYGLVLDTNGDGEADYVMGLDNDAPEQGDFHVWVTDLATGEVEEQVGPPYGFPLEFGHPDEPDMSGGVFLTFLPGSAPPDVTAAVRFYAWAGEFRDGKIVASDYAPDTGWATRQ